MTKVSIVYFSGTGNTAKFAESIGKGAASVAGVEMNLVAINENDISKGRYKNDEVINALDASDAIIFGSPTYMGGLAAQFKAFADATVGAWFQQKWRGKIAAGFTLSGTPSGDKFNTLQHLQTIAMQHGMIWVGLGEMPMQPNGVNRIASWVGAMAQSGQGSPDIAITDEDKLTGEILGKRVATFTAKNQTK